jgi:hypothetical protein
MKKVFYLRRFESAPEPESHPALFLSSGGTSSLTFIDESF